MIEVRVNGEPEELGPETTVAEVVGRWAKSPAGVAVAVNEAVVTRADWDRTVLAAGDRVEILTAVQGG